MDAPPYVNWIANQSNCFLHNIFAQLKEQVKKDVEEANHFSPLAKKGYTFKWGEPEPDRTFAVIRQNPSAQVEGGAEFVLNGESIRIHCPNHPDAPLSNQQNYALHVKSHWDAKANCCQIIMNDTVYELWEISQIALSYLIFPQK